LGVALSESFEVIGIRHQAYDTKPGPMLGHPGGLTAEPILLEEAVRSRARHIAAQIRYSMTCSYSRLRNWSVFNSSRKRRAAMDLSKAIQDLCAEKEKLARATAALEELERAAGGKIPRAIPKNG
jgi:hypothetical protein